MITYDFHIDSQILEIFLKEVINIEDIILTVQYLSEDAELPKNIKVVVHSGNTEYLCNPKNLNMLLTLLKKSFENYETIKCSLIDKNHKESQLYELLKYVSDSENFNYKFFINKEDALKWLN